MISSLNSFGGLSAAQLLTLFGANSSSSSSSTSASAAQSASTSASSTDATDPAATIKTILAQAQIGTSSEGWGSIATAEATYVAQMGSYSSIISASVMIASPDAATQIADAVSQINQTGIIAQYDVNPSTNNGVSSYETPITVTANDALNVTISDGVVSATAMQGATFPAGVPSLASIQQALSDLKTEDQTIGWNGVQATPEATAEDVANAWWDTASGGSFTLVKMPPGTTGAIGGNIVVFSASGDDNNKWALVLPQNTVSVALSGAQVDG